MKALNKKIMISGLVLIFIAAAVITAVCISLNDSEDVLTAADFGLTATVENVTKSSATYILSHSSDDVCDTVKVINSTNNISMVYARDMDSVKFVGSFSTGGDEFYRIERLEKGEWINVEPKINGFISTLDCHSITSLDKPLEFKIDWCERYGALSAGTYRLVKNVSARFGTETIDLDVYAEFEIK